DGDGEKHEIVVPGAAIVRHDELVVQAEEVEAQPLEELGRQHIAEAQHPDPGIAARLPGMRADSFDRIEIPKIHDVRARLAVDPHDGRRGGGPGRRGRAWGCAAARGATERSVSSTRGGPRRRMSGSRSGARAMTAGANAPPPL